MMRLGALSLRRPPPPALRRLRSARASASSSARAPRLAVHGSCPVAIPKELLEGFRRAEATPAPFGTGISIADHCLQVATDVHYADWVPSILRRDMVVMALFHDVFYAESPAGHGELASRCLEGRLHPSVRWLCAGHAAAPRKPTASPMTQKMLDAFVELDCRTIHSHREWHPLEFFRERGYFRALEAEEARAMPSWLSPNASLVWAAPSMGIERVPVLLASALGLFEAAGLPPVELRVADGGGPELRRWMREGLAQVAEVEAMGAAAPEAGAPRRRPRGRPGGCLASLSPEVRCLEGLRGRRVAMASKGSCESYALRAMLREAGIDPSEVTEVPVGVFYGRLDVLRDQQVDAAFIAEPYLSHLEAAGSVRALATASPARRPPQSPPGAALAASEHVLAEAPDLVGRLAAVHAAGAGAGGGAAALGALRDLGPRCFGVSGEALLAAVRKELAGCGGGRQA